MSNQCQMSNQIPIPKLYKFKVHCLENESFRET